MIVPIVPHPDTRRTSRKGGSSRTASRSSSPVGSVGIPDEDETDESENMDLGNYNLSMGLKLVNQVYSCLVVRYV
jgi:hypothetical protein